MKEEGRERSVFMLLLLSEATKQVVAYLNSSYNPHSSTAANINRVERSVSHKNGNGTLV